LFLDVPGKDVDELLSDDARKDNPSKARQAAKRMLDILDAAKGEPLKQEDLFRQVANDVGMSAQTVRRKAYFGREMVRDLGLVKSYKDGFEGGWFVKRSELARPPEFL
jgi:DNA-binding winged helix-turn-helix (wHTH) protein